MNLETLFVNSKHELLKHRDAILQLFEDSFKQKLDVSIWNWAYQESNEDPLVSLCYDGDLLVGHYAVIPFLLVQDKKQLKGLLSMTTMVHSSYRRHGLFIRQSQEVYNEAQKMGYDFVFGFPNKNSAPGFKKRLNWEIPEVDYIATLSGKEIINSPLLKSYFADQSTICFDYNTSNLEWRTSKGKYEILGETVLKKYGDKYDIISVGSNYKECINPDMEYNLLVDHSLINKLEILNKSEYQFGYFSLNKGLNMKFKKELILSDVF